MLFSCSGKQGSGPHRGQGPSEPEEGDSKPKELTIDQGVRELVSWPAHVSGMSEYQLHWSEGLPEGSDSMSKGRESSPEGWRGLLKALRATGI